MRAPWCLMRSRRPMRSSSTRRDSSSNRAVSSVACCASRAASVRSAALLAASSLSRLLASDLRCWMPCAHQFMVVHNVAQQHRSSAQDALQFLAYS